MKQLSTLTKLYLVFINLFSGYILISSLFRVRIVELLFLAFLALLGGISHILKVEGPTNRSHYTISFIIFGFTLALFGSPAVLIVILAANLFEWMLIKAGWLECAIFSCE